MPHPRTFAEGRLRALGLALALAGLVSCGSTEPTIQLEGTYDMRSAGGVALPTTLSDGTTLVSAQMDIGSAMSFTLVPTYRTSTQTYTTSISGTVVRDGNNLTYSGVSGPIATGTVEPGVVTFVQDKVYRLERR